MLSCRLLSKSVQKLTSSSFTSSSSICLPSTSNSIPSFQQNSFQKVRFYAKARRTAAVENNSNSEETKEETQKPVYQPITRTAPSSSENNKINISIDPREYIHVYDSSTNITRVETGPKNFVRKENERVIRQPTRMNTVLPNHYAIIRNPVKRNSKNEIVYDDMFGQVEIRDGAVEYRFEQPPFPLYPGEVCEGIKNMPLLGSNQALKIRSKIPHVVKDDSNEEKFRQVGEEWLFKGPGIYKPAPEEEIIETINASIVKPFTALKIEAKKEILDANGSILHYPEDIYLERKVGIYMPHVNEKIIGIEEAVTIPDNKALTLVATNTFVDIYGRNRVKGDEYLITSNVSSQHIVDVNEKFNGWRDLQVVPKNSYVIIENPVDKETGKNQIGKRKIVVGEDSFFLQPGETHSGMHKAISLNENKAVIVKATENFEEQGISRKTGEEWLVYGPREYIPPLDVTVGEIRDKVLLPDNRGAYVINNKTGEIVVKTGAFFIEAHESLWEKKLDKVTENLLGGQQKNTQVTYLVPQGEACQVYNTTSGTSRVVVGTDVAKLAPNEEFVIQKNVDSAAKPTLTRSLGPERTVVEVDVETIDHSKLKIQFQLEWQFNVTKNAPQSDLANIFTIQNLHEHIVSIIGTKARQAVSKVSFPHFNSNWSLIINESLLSPDGSPYHDQASKLQITKLDVLDVRPVDANTKKLLDESVKKTVVMTTEAALQAAQYAANLSTEQGKLKADATLDAIKAQNELQNEKELNAYWEWKAKNARLESQVVMASAQVAAAAKIYEAREVALAEAERFNRMVSALGQDTLKAIAQSSSTNDMVKGLGLKGFLLTDGKTPINLIDTAQRMFSDISNSASNSSLLSNSSPSSSSPSSSSPSSPSIPFVSSDGIEAVRITEITAVEEFKAENKEN